jgi:ABC-type multidrug transport system fused ATPase/permease subunit
LLRFWDYEEGSILLGGRELREWDEEEARRLFAVVSQRTHLFGGTIRENLLLARPQASDEEVVRAAQRARLHDFVQTLPRRYETWVGEQGLLLSGGERQRLAIARALLKDAPILILDEATANLDSLTEREVLRAVRDLRQGRTTLTISHRLAGLADADEILVLQAGRVVERGRHEELLAWGGLYRRMWDLQSQSLPAEAV